MTPYALHQESTMLALCPSRADARILREALAYASCHTRTSCTSFVAWVAWANEWLRLGVSARAITNAVMGQECYDHTQEEVNMRTEARGRLQ